MYFFPLLCYIEQTKRVGGGLWRGRAAFYLLIEEAVSPSLPTPAPTRHPCLSLHFCLSGLSAAAILLSLHGRQSDPLGL